MIENKRYLGWACWTRSRGTDEIETGRYGWNVSSVDPCDLQRFSGVHTQGMSLETLLESSGSLWTMQRKRETLMMIYAIFWNVCKNIIIIIVHLLGLFKSISLKFGSELITHFAFTFLSNKITKTMSLHLHWTWHLGTIRSQATTVVLSLPFTPKSHIVKDNIERPKDILQLQSCKCL